MSRLIEKNLDELCDNAIGTVERIMGRYGAGLEEACAMAGITAIDYSEWKEVQASRPVQEEPKLSDNKFTQKMMDKIDQLLAIGITLENACEFAKISVEEYEEYKNRKK